VDGKTAATFASTRQTALSLTASDEGAFLHVAEASAIEVFDSTGKLKRTLELKDDRAALAMAAVPRGSSLFLGQGEAVPSASTVGPMSGAMGTADPPTTSTIVDAAKDLAGSAPLQQALLVALAILLGCWLLIRWYDRRAVRSR
jgi:hypothetical protein